MKLKFSQETGDLVRVHKLKIGTVLLLNPPTAKVPCAKYGNTLFNLGGIFMLC